MYIPDYGISKAATEIYRGPQQRAIIDALDSLISGGQIQKKYNMLRIPEITLPHNNITAYLHRKNA